MNRLCSDLSQTWNQPDISSLGLSFWIFGSDLVWHFQTNWKMSLGWVGAHTCNLPTIWVNLGVLLEGCICHIKHKLSFNDKNYIMYYHFRKEQKPSFQKNQWKIQAPLVLLFYLKNKFSLFFLEEDSSVVHRWGSTKHGS